jgi:hypothetical protein
MGFIFTNYREQKMNDNLSNRIWCAKHDAKDIPTELTDEQKSEILRLIGSGCRSKTKEKLSRRMDLPLSCWNNFGIYSRIVFNDGQASYICGQSWTDEMRTLRECILD